MPVKNMCFRKGFLSFRLKAADVFKALVTAARILTSVSLAIEPCLFDYCHLIIPGCGGKIYDGWVNVDKYDHYPIDILHDLETFPYPFDDDSCNEILLSHVLEHLGRDTEVFNNIVKELFRVCCHDALIHIIVPHPRHDNFLSDPTHVRPINEHVIALYDNKRNLEWEAIGAANTPLGLLLMLIFA
jgi:hypothetical protein